MPPTTEPLSRNFLDETFFWILADKKVRQALRAHNSPRTPYGRSSNTQFRALWREHASPADPNRFAANRLASSTSSAYRDAARGAMRVLSA